MKRQVRIGIVVTMCILGLAFAGMALAQNGGTLQVPRSSLNGGGGESSAGQFMIRGTSGQPDAGIITGGTFQIRGGFWQSSRNHTVYLPLVLRDE